MIRLSFVDICVVIGVAAGAGFGGCKAEEPIDRLIAQWRNARPALQDEATVQQTLAIVAATRDPDSLGTLCVIVMNVESIPDDSELAYQTRFDKGQLAVFEAGIDQLVALNSAEAGRVLVSLIGKFDAYPSVCVDIAITRLGNPALPALRECTGPRRESVKLMEAAIQRGEIWTP